MIFSWKKIIQTIALLLIVQTLLLMRRNIEFDRWSSSSNDGEGLLFQKDDFQNRSISSSSSSSNFTNSYSSSSLIKSDGVNVEPPQIPKQIVILERYDKIHDLPSLLLINVQNTIDMYLSHWGDDLADRKKTNFTSHYQRMEALLDSPRVWYLNDTDCIKAINDFEPRLLKYYENTKLGTDKSDICRIAALYLKGGYYFDTDMQVVKPLSIEPHITFVSPWEAYDNNGLKGVFNSFIAVAPRHPILKLTGKHLLMALKANTNPHKLGTATLYQALKEFTKLGDKEALSISKGKTMYSEDHYDKNITGTKWPVDVSLKEEHLSKLNVPNFPRHENVGSSCCCDYVVYDMYDGDISFYSRIAGAGRYCKLAHTIPQRVIFVESNYSSIEDIPEKIKTKTLELKKQYDPTKNWDDEFLLYEKCREMVLSVEPKLYERFMEGSMEYKQKVCKLSYLYAKGGYYYDTDAHIEHPIIIDSHNERTSMFCAIKKTSTSDSYELDDSFLAVSSNHPFVRIQLDLLVNELSESQSHMNVSTMFTLAHEGRSVVGGSNNMVAFERFYAGDTKGFRVSDWPVEFVVDHVTPASKI